MLPWSNSLFLTDNDYFDTMEALLSLNESLRELKNSLDIHVVKGKLFYLNRRYFLAVFPAYVKVSWCPANENISAYLDSSETSWFH